MAGNTQHILPSVFLWQNTFTLQFDFLSVQAYCWARRYLQTTRNVWTAHVYWEEKTNNMLQKWQSSSTKKRNYFLKAKITVIKIKKIKIEYIVLYRFIPQTINFIS